LFSTKFSECVNIIADAGLPPPSYAIDTEEEVTLSQGAEGAERLSDFRGGEGSFYGDVLNNIMIYVCEQDDSNKDRCVPEGEAAKGGDGKCITPPGSPCDGVTLCERTSNCYWPPASHFEERVPRYTQQEADDNEDFLLGIDQDSYAFSVAKYIAFALILAILNILIWGIFFIGRCCCCCLHNTCFCRCCSHKPKEEGYNLGCQVRLPIFVYLFFLACIVGSAAVAMVGNGDLGKALNDLFDHSREGLGDLQQFLGNANNPMVEIGNLVDGAADDSLTILGGTDYVEYGMTNVKNRLEAFTTVYEGGIKKAGAEQQVTDTLSNLDAQIDPIVADIRTVLDSLEQSLVEGKESLKEAIGDASDQIVDLNSTVNDMFDDVNDLDQKVEDARLIRGAGVLGIFAVAFLCVIFGFLGVISYWTPCKWDDILIYLLNLTWFFGSLVVTFSWILAGITLFLAVFWNDACHWLDIVVEDFEPYLGETAAVGMNACFNNTPLVEAFNLTSQVDFQEVVDAQIAEINSTDIAGQFTTVSEPLTEINDLVKGITTSTEFNELIEKLNTNTNLESSDTNCGSGLSPSDCNAAKLNCKFNVNAFTKAQLDAGEFSAPWDLITSTSVPTGTGTAQWVDKVTLATGVSFARESSETGAEWVARIFNAAGVDSVSGARCNSGATCNYICEPFETFIKYAYGNATQAKQWQDDMLIDLGVEYPPYPAGCPAGKTCPTPAWTAAGNPRTIKQELLNYQNNITTTTNDIIGIANTAVGDIMDQVSLFLCNMNCGFVGELYNNVHGDMCVTLLGGVIQISAGFWLLAIFMFLNSALGSMLVVRLRGISTAQFEERDSGAVEMKAVNLDLYN